MFSVNHSSIDDYLIISAIGSTNSILLSSYLHIDNRVVLYISLVDLGYTGLVFLDFKFATRYRILTFRLPKRLPLFLADGVLLSWIEWATILTLRIGDHIEQLRFYITTLAEDHPIILGLPWLRK